MRAGASFAAAVVALGWLLAAGAQQPGDSATLSRGEGLVGEQVLLTLEVVTGPGAVVEVDPSHESWGELEVIRIQGTDVTVAGDTALHRIELIVAGFGLGPIEARPVVNILDGGGFNQRTLPAVAFEVVSTLQPGEPLELTPLAGPVGIGGGQSPLLVPAVVAGAVVGAGVILLAAWWVVRRAVRPRPVVREEEPSPAIPELGAAAELLDSDPVGAYRQMAATVRAALAERYRFPARALTTRELQRRMEAVGVDRWEARLVAGLLEECDSVVYAGYRPAGERRQSDLRMAQEILEAAP